MDRAIAGARRRARAADRPVAPARKTVRWRHHRPRARARGRRDRRSRACRPSRSAPPASPRRRHRTPAMCRWQAARSSSPAAATSTGCCSRRPGTLGRRVARVAGHDRHGRLAAGSTSRRPPARIARRGSSAPTARTASSGDGSASTFRRDQLSIATGFFAHGVTSDEIAIEFVADPPGYIWSFPRPGHLAIGICAQADAGVIGGRLATGRRPTGSRGHGSPPGARLEAYSWPIPSLPAADLETPAAGRPGLAARRRRRRPGRSDHPRRDLLRAALGGVGRRRRSARATRSRGAATSSACARRSAPSSRSAARLKSRFFRPGFTRLLIDALRHSASVRTVMADLVVRTAGLLGPEMAPAQDPAARRGGPVLLRQGPSGRRSGQDP